MSTEDQTAIGLATQGSITLAGAESAALIAAIQGQCFPRAWTPSSVREILAMPGTQAIIATAEDGSAVGFALVGVGADEAELLSIGVLPGYRRGGVGEALLKAVLELARTVGAVAMFLEVAVDNLGAVALYDAAGFVETGRRPGYYHLPTGERVDAICMRRDVGRTDAIVVS